MEPRSKSNIMAATNMGPRLSLKRLGRKAHTELAAVASLIVSARITSVSKIHSDAAII